MNRTFEVTSIQADDPESNYQVYYNLAQVKEQLPQLAPIITEEDFHSIKLVAGLNSLEITVCSEEEDIEAEQGMQALDQRLDPTAKCTSCGMQLEFGKIHEHQCVDPDGMSPEGQQAWNAFQQEQALEPTWEERERQADQERLAYCGWEEF
jgi:hypothetical protein